MKPGIYENIPFKDYVEIEALNSSYLKNFVGSGKVPAHALLPDKDSKDKAFGRALHVYLLDGINAFFNDHLIMPEFGDLRKKEGKEKKAEYEAKHGIKIWRESSSSPWESDSPKTILPYTDYGKIKTMEKAINAHPGSHDLLSNSSRKEITVIWHDLNTGALCKGRIDFIPDNVTGVIGDLKKTKSAEKFIFGRDIINYKYFVSGQFYLEGLHANGLTEFDTVSMICAETEPPYRVELHTLESEWGQAGFNYLRKAIDLALKCKKENFYPHYKNPGSNSIPCPPYLLAEDIYD